MADLNLTNLLLNGVTEYGPAVLGSALLLGGVGVPVPGTLLVSAAGALARQGGIEWSVALLVGFRSLFSDKQFTASAIVLHKVSTIVWYTVHEDIRLWFAILCLTADI
jgi:hypothetical protein